MCKLSGWIGFGENTGFWKRIVGEIREHGKVEMP